MERIEYGLQMYSIRDITQDSMRKALEEVAAMGYKYVEFAGFFDYNAEQIKTWLDTFGLVCLSTHSRIFTLEPEAIEETIRYHKIIGCDTIIATGCNFSTKEKAETVIKTLNEAQKTLAENGIRLGYHNHSREFYPSPEGTVFADEIIGRTSIELEPDIFWLFNAGVDVIEFLETHKDRIRIVHLKDGIPSGAEYKNYERANLGSEGFSTGGGCAPIREVREWAIQNNVRMVVESEGLNPTGLQEVGRCIEFLRTLD